MIWFIPFLLIGLPLMTKILAGLTTGLAVIGCNGGQHKVMEGFVTGFASKMMTDYPGNNFLVWHNHGNKPQEVFFEHTHVHHEIDIPCGTTEGYEVHSFHFGSFNMDGDRGLINWGFGGNYLRDPEDGPNVEFYPPVEPQPYVVDSTETAERGIAGNGDNKLPAWSAGVHQKESIWKSPVRKTDPIVELPEAVEGASPKRWNRPAAAKRALEAPNDGAYLVFCNTTSDAMANSGVAYYNDFKPGQNVGELPDELVWVEQGHNPFFRKSTGAVEFLGGKTGLHWGIWGGMPGNTTYPGQLAGLANDGVDNFFLYRDAGEQLFATEEYTCFSKYYAF